MHTAIPGAVHLDRRMLDEAVDRLVKALAPRAVYLFGSFAVGLAKPDSDIDLMLILADESVTVDHHRQGYAAVRGLGLPVELHFESQDRYDRFAAVFGSLQNDVQRKGIRLYAAES